MDVFSNLDLFSVGLSVAGILILGFIVYLEDRSSETNRAFFGFALMTSLWSTFNYLSYQSSDPEIVIWLIRAAVFFAVWHSFYVFHFCYVFPNQKVRYTPVYFLLIFLVFVGSFLNLTPLVFERVVDFSEGGRVAKIMNGPAIPFFGILVGFLNIGGLVILARRILKLKKGERRPYFLILSGFLITLSLILCFNFIFPAIFDNARYQPLGALFVLPFVLITFYTILKHNVLNIKVVSTQLLTFGLAAALLLEVVLAKNLVLILYKISLFLLVLSIGLLLIKSIKKEIDQREQVTKMAGSLEKANARLRVLDRQKTEFLSIASHQLRTPLSIIKGYVELISDGAYGRISKKTKDVLTDIDTSNERLVKLVDEFLDITRIEQGRTKYVFEPSRIKDTVDSVVEELSSKATDKGLHIESSVKFSQKIVFDREKIRHVTFNFLDNAIKYTDKGGVTVIAEPGKGGLVVRVRDTGMGFGKEDENNFFQKFYRGRNVVGTNVNGTGLGIYVCKKFIEAHGGHVWAHSPGLGKGSEFGFWIPCDLKKGQRVPEETEQKK